MLPLTAFGQAPSLGSAANFVLFSTSGAVTNTGISQLTGNVGTNVGASTGFGNVNGNMHDVDAASALAATDLLSAYNALNTMAATFTLGTPLGNGDTLIPGVYLISSAATLNGNLVLNAQGNPAAVFIFQVQGAFSTNPSSRVVLINGAKAANVFWKTEGLVNMLPSTIMKGTIIANNAAIVMSAGDSLEGRALSTTGAVTVNNIVAFTPVTSVLFGPLAPALASVACYSLFSANGAVSNSGATNATGDIGTNVGVTTGYTSGLVTGTIHLTPDASTGICATDLGTVYTGLNALTPDIELMVPASFGLGQILTPHTYLLNAATTMTDTLFLDAQGHSGAVFVIKVNGAFVATVSARVILVNGAQAKNIYWLVQGAVTLNSGVIFNGTIVANNAAILINSGAVLNGRALTTTGALTTTAATIIANTLPNPGTISGPTGLFIGGTIGLTDLVTGGTWSSSNGAATVSAGLVTGVSAGIDTIRYVVTNLCGMDTATKIVTVMGVPNVCVGASLSLSDVATGGAWSSSNGNANVVAGLVVGVAAGTDTIRYIVATGCGADTAMVAIVINPLPNAGTISGTPTACAGSTTVLTDGITGGTWLSSNAHATVVSGTVTGVSNGIDTILYISTTVCGSDTARDIVTISPLPLAGTITGTPSVCESATSSLADAATGGTWTSVSTTVATVNASGVVSGVAFGTSLISYTVTNSCGTAVATSTVTVSPLPIAGSITGTPSVCASATSTLADVATGGTWTSLSTGIATVNASGVVTGVAFGTSLISYTVTNSCGTDVATSTVTVSPLPIAGSITGTPSVCESATSSLADVATGGTWTSVPTGVATVNASGVVSGVAFGTSLISYTVTNSCGTAVATSTVTVSPLPIAGSITGTPSVCASATSTLADVATGGTWTSVSTGIATVNTSGVVTGVAFGTSLISYTVTNSCGTDVATSTVTVSPLPIAGSITGTPSVCESATSSLADAATGGTWTSVSTGVATVNASGVVSGVAFGTSLISYTVTNSCGTAVATSIVTVSPLPIAGSITGTPSVCASATSTLADVATGGTWTSVSTGVATVNASGVVTGVAFGTSLISYTVTNSCGTDVATSTITVSPLPIAGGITGTPSVCESATSSLADAASGGTWTSVSIGIATVNASGVVSGVAFGTSLISYTVTNSCGTAVATSTVTVSPLPLVGTIGGGSLLCFGSVVTLTNSVTGGAWSSSNATANVVSGVVTGVSIGTDTISYLVTNSCGSIAATKTITVSPLPNAGTIIGGSNVCIGNIIALTDGTTGGTWTSGNTNATVVGGIVTGVTSGTDTIGYLVTNACGSATASALITINPAPNAGVITY